MNAPTKKAARPPAVLCRGCLAPFAAATVARLGALPEHRVALPEGGFGGRCPGVGRPPREPGYGRSHTVITTEGTSA